MGRNNAICKASFHLATHMDGEKHFWSRGRTIGQVPLDHWIGPVSLPTSRTWSPTGRIYAGDAGKRGPNREGDILLIKTGFHRYGWNSPDSDEFRYMIRHPGPLPAFSDWSWRRRSTGRASTPSARIIP